MERQGSQHLVNTSYGVVLDVNPLARIFKAQHWVSAFGRGGTFPGGGGVTHLFKTPEVGRGSRSQLCDVQGRKERPTLKQRPFMWQAGGSAPPGPPLIRMGTLAAGSTVPLGSVTGLSLWEVSCFNSAKSQSGDMTAVVCQNSVYAGVWGTTFHRLPLSQGKQSLCVQKTPERGPNPAVPKP